MVKWAFATVLPLLVACSTSGGGAPAPDGGREPPPADDSGAGDTSAPSEDASAPSEGGADVGVDAHGDAPPECNKLANLGSPVPGNLVANAAPAPTGGTLVDGTYVLTKYQVYTGPGGQSGPSGQSLASTLALAGSTYEAVSSTGGSDTRVNGTFTTSGTSYTATVTCPGGPTTALGYTFDGTTFVQLGNVGVNTLELTYTKR
jgi:hypothetical protein